MNRFFSWTIFALAICLRAAPAFSAAFTESPDAGNTPATSLVLPANTTRVEGTVVPNDYDLYLFAVAMQTTMTIDLGESNFDDNLLLFNAAGQGLTGNDDGGDGLDSRIIRLLPAGNYYLGVGLNNMAAFTDSGIEFIDNDDGDLANPSTLSLGYIGHEFGFGHGTSSAYALTFSVATGPVVPEPSSAVLLLSGLAILLRRK